MKALKYFIGMVLLVFVSCTEDTTVLTGSGNITGTVVEVGTNTPLENAKVSTNPTTSTVFTDENGNFAILNVPTQNYSVKAEKDGYTPKFEGIDVLDESTINVVFELDVSTAGNVAPNTPILTSPLNNAIDQPLEVTLTWEGSDPEDDELTYNIEVLNDRDSSVITVPDLATNTHTLTDLSYGTKYFWSVTANDGINDDVQSAVYTFETLPFPVENRFFFTRKIDGNNVIFSSDEEGNEFQLTSEATNSWRPRRANTIDKLAYLSTNGAQTHIFTMNLDGSGIEQVTNTTPVNGFNLDEVDFCWNANDTKFYYPNFDKLYEIVPNGTGLNEVYQTTDGNFITEVDVNQTSTKLALKTNNNVGYNVSIYTIDMSGTIVDTVLSGVMGAAGGIDFSFDSNLLLYTYDISATENSLYRQLNNHIFTYDFTTMLATDVSLHKPAGTNDYDARFSPNEAEVIFMNTSNDGVSQENISKVELSTLLNRTELFQDASMPEWK